MAVHFATFLVRRGYVSPQDVLDAMDERARLHRPFGKICLELGFLRIKQVFEILSAQDEDPRPFGAVAVSKGLLTDAQVGRVLDTQRRERPRIGEALVGLTRLSRDALDEATQLYRSESVLSES